MAIMHKLKRSLTSDSRPAGGRKSNSLRLDDGGPSRPLSGVFVSQRTPAEDETEDPSSSESSCCSHSSFITSQAIAAVSWRSSGAKEHHKGSPAIVASLDEEHPEQITRAQRLARVMERSAKLPDTWYFSSNHVLVNQERTSRTIAPLIRMRGLDEIARAHAEQMGAEGDCRHLELDALRAALKDVPFRRLGENVQKGQSIRSIHNMMMNTLSNKNNIIDRRFTHMGMGTAVGKDGLIYLCQVFRG